MPDKGEVVTRLTEDINDTLHSDFTVRIGSNVSSTFEKIERLCISTNPSSLSWIKWGAQR